MKSFQQYIKESADEHSNQYDNAASEIGDMFDWLRRIIRTTMSKSRISMDSEARKRASDYLKQLMRMVDPNISESFGPTLGLTKNSDGNYNLDELIQAMRSRILSIISSLKDSEVMRTINSSHGKMISDLKGIGTELGRLRSGDVNVQDMEEARYNLQDLANSISGTKKVIYYRSSNGRLVPSQIDPSDAESLERLLRLIIRGGSSKVVVALPGSTDKGITVDLNRAGRVAQIRSDEILGR